MYCHVFFGSQCVCRNLAIRADEAYHSFTIVTVEDGAVLGMVDPVGHRVVCVGDIFEPVIPSVLILHTIKTSYIC